MDLIEIWIAAMLGLSAVLAVGAAWMEVWGCGHSETASQGDEYASVAGEMARAAHE